MSFHLHSLLSLTAFLSVSAFASSAPAENAKLSLFHFHCEARSLFGSVTADGGFSGEVLDKGKDRLFDEGTQPGTAELVTKNAEGKELQRVTLETHSDATPFPIAVENTNVPLYFRIPQSNGRPTPEELALYQVSSLPRYLTIRKGVGEPRFRNEPGEWDASELSVQQKGKLPNGLLKIPATCEIRLR